jgi:hypothetical protein
MSTFHLERDREFVLVSYYPWYLLLIKVLLELHATQYALVPSVLVTLIACYFQSANCSISYAFFLWHFLPSGIESPCYSNKK